jgi:hypothetical protein
MEIGGTTSPFAAGFAVSQKTPMTGTQQADASASPTDASRTYQRAMGTTAGGASDLLGNNFVHADSGPSKYVAATITNLQTDMSFSDKMGSLLGSLDAQYAALTGSGVSGYAAATLMQHKVKEGVKQVTNDEYMDQSADNMDDLKDEIERRAEEATQPKDASQIDTSEITETNASTDAATATSPTDQAAQDASSPGADAQANAAQQGATSPDSSVTAPAAGEGANQQNATASAAAQGGTTASQTTRNPAQTPPTTASLDILV